MDFANRGTRPVTGDVQPSNIQPAGASRKGNKFNQSKIGKASSLVLLVSVSIVIAALIAALVFADSKGERRYIKSDQYQAVFLDGGQVYFGKITSYSSTYLVLTDIFYLRVNQQQTQNGQAAAQNDVSLAKLGNELHGPEDEMIINREHIQFWENLKNEGQVVTAIREFKKNPNANNQQSQSQDQTQQQQTQQTTQPATPTPPTNTNNQNRR